MRDEEKNQGLDELEKVNDADLTNDDDNTNVDINSGNDAATNVNDETYMAAEFEGMEKVVVINGKKRKERKKKKKLSKEGKIVLNCSIGAVCLALFLTVAIMFGPMIVAILKGGGSVQSMEGAELIVDMTDCKYYFGTEGNVDLTKTFPGGTEFKIGETNESNASINNRGVLTVAEEGLFEITYKSADETITEPVVVECEAKEGINVDTWEGLRNAVSLSKVIMMQDNLASPVLSGEKRDKHGSLTIHNDVYGNGKVLNLFEIVCSRKGAGKKYPEPHLEGNGKGWGEAGFVIRDKEDGGQILIQDLHITGNDMSLDAPVYEGDESTTPEGGEVAPTADGDEEEEERVLLKRAGNLYGLSSERVASRGVLLFSKYGNLVDIDGSNGEKGNVKINHCLFENGGKVLHICDSNVEIEGSIVRNAADTAISIATYANCASYVKSKNNVIANSLTGGVLFYCFDGNISESNAAATWNTFEIVEGSFLDIFNWKEQNGLAFLPETEGFADIANPIAKSEIPKTSYDSLKGDVDGSKYIHFAIIKIRTGGGLPRNDSQVVNAASIRYTTARENGFDKGFPIPSIAGAIMKDIDVWGYYGVSDGDVTPTAKLGGETAEDLAKFYKELREGRIREEAKN